MLKQYPKSKIVRLKGAKYKKLQIVVLEKFDFTCQECGAWTTAPPHHIKFRSKGGSDTEDNLICLCVDCHYKKHN
jgi:5-methylcytosine-specific restriction endonuclease McrA